MTEERITGSLVWKWADGPQPTRVYWGGIDVWVTDPRDALPLPHETARLIWRAGLGRDPPKFTCLRSDVVRP
jgi:hypothetical protein